jgi:hypothetical protein
MIPSTVVGTVTGTGAALNVILGFKPDFVQLVNATDGDQVDVWYRGMAALTSINVGGATAATRAAPNGISSYEREGALLHRDPQRTGRQLTEMGGDHSPPILVGRVFISNLER